MEIPIYSAPFDMDEESLKKELDIRSDELYQLVAKNGKFVNYLKEKDVATVTIALYVPWDRDAEESYSVYDYNL